MTFLEAVEEATKSAGIVTLAFANIKEFNAFKEGFRFEDYPVNVVVPFDNNGTHVNGRRKAAIPLQGWVLTRISSEPIDYRSAKVESQYIAPMRRLAIRFLSSLLDSDVIDPELSSAVTDSIRPAYNFLDNHLFGVSYTCNVPIVETIECK